MSLFVYLLRLFLSFRVDKKQQFIKCLVNLKIVIPDIRPTIGTINRE